MLSYRSALAINANLRERNRRLAQQIKDLEDRLSALLGQHAFGHSGLGAPAALHTELEQRRQQILDLTRALGEREEDFAAAREANRRLMNQVNCGNDRR